MFLQHTHRHQTAMNHYDACNAARCILSTPIRATVPLRSPHVSASTPASWRGAVSNKMLFTHLEVEQASACVSSLITRLPPAGSSSTKPHTRNRTHSARNTARMRHFAGLDWPSVTCRVTSYLGGAPIEKRCNRTVSTRAHTHLAVAHSAA